MPWSTSFEVAYKPNKRQSWVWQPTLVNACGENCSYLWDTFLTHCPCIEAMGTRWKEIAFAMRLLVLLSRTQQYTLTYDNVLTEIMMRKYCTGFLSVFLRDESVKAFSFFFFFARFVSGFSADDCLNLSVMPSAATCRIIIHAAVSFHLPNQVMLSH